MTCTSARERVSVAPCACASGQCACARPAVGKGSPGVSLMGLESNLPPFLFPPRSRSLPQTERFFLGLQTSGSCCPKVHPLLCSPRPPRPSNPRFFSSLRACRLEALAHRFFNIHFRHVGPLSPTVLPFLYQSSLRTEGCFRLVCQTKSPRVLCSLA